MSSNENEKFSVGEHRVSITILRKTHSDLLVSQHTMERWFVSEETAVRALQDVASVFIESEATSDLRESNAADQRLEDDRERKDAEI